MSRTQLDQAQRILVLRLGAIGDVLRVLPALARLKRDRPEVEVGWAIENWVHPVVAGHPAVDRFHVLNRREIKAGAPRAVAELRRHVREIRGHDYDIVLDFHGRLKSGLIARFSGIPARVGFARGDSTEGNHLFTNVHVRLADRWENRVLRFLHLLEPLGLDTSYDPDALGIHLAAELRDGASRWYEEAGRPALAVYPGTSLLRMAERWPKEKWIELLAGLGGEGIASVVFWGPAEAELAAEIAAAAGAGAVLAPPTALPEMMAMLGCFRAFLGSDTAAMHMSWMQGVPTGVFVGPKPPRTVAPLAPVPSRVLRVAEHFKEGMGRRHQPAEIITEVPVSEAAEAVRYLISCARRDVNARG